MAPQFDVIIVGAGHNGLVAANYLARYGFSVLVVERRGEPGGCAATVSTLGMQANVCNCDHTMIRATGIIDELSLGSFGLRYLEIEPSKHYLVVEGERRHTPWWLFHDIEATLAGIAHTHPEEEGSYKHYLAEVMPLAKLFLRLVNTPPSTRALLRAVGGSGGQLAANLHRLHRLSADTALRRWFSSEVFRAPAAAATAMWGASPTSSGTGLAALTYALSHLVPTGRPVGGSGALPDALARALSDAGGNLRLGVTVDAITCSLSGVRGVILNDGEELTARVVIATTDPRSTILSLIRNPPSRATKMVESWRATPEPLGYESKIDAVVDRAPEFASEENGLRDLVGLSRQSATTTLLTPTTEAIGMAHKYASAGDIVAQPIFLANTPDVVDPSVAPVGGGSTFSLEVLYTPYELRGGWSGSTEPERWLEVFAKHTSNDFLTGVKRWRVVSPLDYEAEFGLRKGYAPSFGGTPLGVVLGRNREISRYKTPIMGLFLAGAGTFPGAGIWGISGRNVATIVASHLNRPRA